MFQIIKFGQDYEFYLEQSRGANKKRKQQG